MRISGKVALVTGGCDGIGKSIVYALLRRGAKVAVLDINDGKGKALESTLKDQFGEGQSVYQHCDVANKRQLEDVFRSVKRRFNGMNIVVNNAGVALGLAEWDKVVDINLKSVIHGTMLGIDMMDKNSGNDGGVIINMASLAGVYPLTPAPVYSATKAAVVSFSRCLREAAKTKGVRVNSICPSYVSGTEMVKKGEKILTSNPPNRRAAESFREVGLISLDTVADAVVKTIEDDTLAGHAIMVSAQHGMQKYEFPSFPSSKL